MAHDEATHRSRDRWRDPGPGIDPDDLATALRVLEQLRRDRRRPPRHPDRQAGHGADVQAGAQGPSPRGEAARDRPRRGDHRQDRHGLPDADRRRDQGHPARVDDPRRPRRRADQPAQLLHLQGGVHPRRRVLPLALPRLRRPEPHQARAAHRPDGQARPAHRRPRQDRDVHRAAAAARRRPPHDHHAVPARRRETLCGTGGFGRLDPPAQGRRHRPARPHPGRRARRRGRRGRSARHPHQQRRPDGAPLARLLLPPRRRRVGAARRRASRCPSW